ncbi:tetratricopeptide repeat protein [Patescibacteria group bacterium]|nr:tetratricopeptide repeat protein [Patescibacteria group bacterium]
MASAIFAVHPIHTEAISWISGRAYPLGALFLLLSSLFYLKESRREESKLKFHFASLFFYFLGNLAEGKAVFFVLIISLYELAFGDLKKNWRKVLGFIVLTILIFGWRFGPLQTRIVGENPEYAGGVEIISPLLQVPTAISSYLELFVWPMPLTLYHENIEMANLQYGLRVAVFLLFLGALFYSYKKEKLLFFALGFFIFPLTPTLLPIKIAWIVAERYVYLSSIGLCLAFSWGLIKLFGKNEKLLLAVFLFIILGFSARTIVRNMDWRTRESLWRSTVKVQPRSSKAWNNMGDIYTGRQEYESALVAFQNAIDIRPLYVDAYHNKGVTYMKMGRYDEAIAKFEEAMAIHILPETLNTLGVAYFEKGEYQKAQDLFLKMLEMNPNDANAYNSLGILALTLKDYQKAQEYWQKALEIDPYAKGPKDNLLLLETQNTAP